MNENFMNLLKDLPISINNLADPAVLRESTERKIEMLIEDGHTGPVALITKGDFSNKWWSEKRLKYWAKNLNLFVFASISELPKKMEPASHEARYRTLQVAQESGAKSIAYIRPIIHTINDSPELIEKMFMRSKESGADAIISSGFRGDKEVVQNAELENVDAPDNQLWMRTLKLTPQSTADHMRQLAKDLNIPYWTRTACAVAALTGKKRSLSPYHIAPKFVQCNLCPLQSTCESSAQFHTPLEHSIELLKELGYQVEVHSAQERYQRCDVEIRSQCVLCCTNCPTAPENLGIPYVNIRRYDGTVPSWGDMSFARFLTGGILVTDPHIPPGENSNIGLKPDFKMPDGKNGIGGLYAVNSWVVWSEYLPASKCLRCNYCFLSMFKDVLPPELNITVGMSPSRIFDYLQENNELNNNNKKYQTISLKMVNP